MAESKPTGSIDEEMGGFESTTACNPLGHGILRRLTYLGQTTTWSWGADFKATVWLGATITTTDSAIATNRERGHAAAN